MPVADLDISPRRTSGRAPKALAVEAVRELGPADLALLASGRGTKPPALSRIRDRHHALARCLAGGMSPAEASAVTGYDVSRISILKSDPTFAELMKHYAQVKESAFAGFQDRASGVALEALNIIAERLEEDPAAVTTSQLLAVVEKLADRTGHAPVTKSVNLNANVDIGSRLAAARKRVAEIQATDVAFEVLPAPPPE